MKTDLPLTTFPANGRPAVHAYFDLCPEDPTGEKVVYFRFDGPMPCGGQVMVANRDGTGARLVGNRTATASAHSGARQQWADPHTAAYNIQAADRRVCELADVRDGGIERLENSIRMFCPETGMALTSTHESLLTQAEKLAQAHEVLVRDSSERKYRSLFDTRNCLALHPRRCELRDTHLLWFKHTKWAPGGARFFVVFHNENARSRGLTSDPRVKCLMVCNADGTGLRYLTEFGHHPMWGADGAFVYYNEVRDGKQDLVRCDLEGHRSVLLADCPGTHSSLSPDSRFLVTDLYHGAGKERGELQLLETATGERQTIASYATPDNSGETGCHAHPAWSRDGKRIYFSNNESGLTQLHALDLCL